MPAEVIQIMNKIDKNDYNNIDGELIKKAQNILKQREDKIGRELFDYALKMKLSESTGISMNSLAQYVLESFKWDVLPEVDSMTIKEFIESLKEDNIIKNAITYKEDNEILIWFVLEEENYENSKNCIREILKYFDNNKMEKFKYFLCDIEDIDEIKEDLQESEVNFEVL